MKKLVMAISVVLAGVSLCFAQSAPAASAGNTNTAVGNQAAAPAAAAKKHAAKPVVKQAPAAKNIKVRKMRKIKREQSSAAAASKPVEKK